jgi:signal peptidase I
MTPKGCVVNQRVRLIIPFFAFVLIAASGCSALRRVAVQPVKVQGSAMEPALKDGDRLIIDRNVEPLKRGDIIVFYYPAEPTKSYIKRIVGLPGEAIEIREGKVFVNGAALDEPYVSPLNNQVMSSRAEIRLSPNSFYVIGDNRDHSSDSRIWGPLERKFIYGRYLRKYYSSS